MAVNLYELSKTTPILDYDHGDEPLWASDTGRNSNSGKYSGTFINYFPQIVLTFGKSTQQQMTAICNAFEHPTVQVTFKNKNNGEWITQTFYGTAIHGKLNKWDGFYEGFNLTLTAIEGKYD